MSVNSRQKGKRAELHLVREYKRHGFTARRSQQYKGYKDAADIICDELDDIFFPECKAREAINLHEALEKATSESGGKIPHVCLKKNHQPWLCVMYLDDWFRIIKNLSEETIEQIKNSKGLDQASD